MAKLTTITPDNSSNVVVSVSVTMKDGNIHIFSDLTECFMYIEKQLQSPIVKGQIQVESNQYSLIVGKE